MANTLITLLAFAFVLGVLVFVHELGHFIAAKRVGIRVLKFQLGFNPTILAVKRGDTVYSLGALPFGGYVKMAGDSPEEERTGRADEFLSRSKWERFQVLVMGPVMNLLLAVGVTAFVLYRGAEVPVYQDQPALIGVVLPSSPAAKADIRSGDLILDVAGHKIDTWEQFFIAIGSRANREVTLGLQRDGREIERKVTPLAPVGQSRFEIGDIGVLPNVHPHVSGIVKAGDPGDRAGVKADDVIVAINGERMVFRAQVMDAIGKRPGQELELSLLRSGEPITVHVKADDRDGRGYLGVYLAEATKSIKPGPIEAVGMSVQRNVEYSGLIFQTVWGLITRETSPKQLMGPVAIAQLSGESAQLGLIPLLSLMASISLNLGLLNLLPIPILDGGHIFIMAIEGLFRRDFSVRVKEKMLLAGFVVLMMLMVTVIYNDLTRISWIERLMPWR